MDSNSNRERGQVLLMATLVIIPLLGILGLVTDLGYMHYVKMTAQAAAEAAAQAALIDFHQTTGGATYSCGGNVVCASDQTNCTPNITTPANSIEHGCMYAQAHGFNSSGSVTYQSGASSVPPTAPGMGTAGYWVTFRAYQRVPQLFSAVLGNTTGLVVGRSTAAIVGSADCIYALNPNAPAAISVGGSASLNSSCGLYVNSNNACAISTNGGGTISSSEYDIVGNACVQTPLTPSPNLGVRPLSDPLASLPAPAAPTYHCDQWNYRSPNNGADTLEPGTYCGGISIGNSTVTLSPGVYILVGGGLSTQSANSIVSGSGVMFYNTFGLTDHGGQTLSYSPISISANSSASFTAPSSGTYAGVLFFDDRNAPSGNRDTYGGGSNAVYQGTIYNKNNGITMYGNSSVKSQYSLMVADTISIMGNAAFNNNYSSLPNGASPLQKVMVVE